MPTLKEIFARRVAEITATNPDWESATKLAKKTYWPRGKKKGERVAARTVSYALRTDDEAPSPALDLVEAIAKTLNVAPWELLTDKVEGRRKIIERLLDEGQLAGDAFDLPPKSPPRSRNPSRKRPPR